MIDLPLLNPRLQQVVETAAAGEREKLNEAVRHLVPEFGAHSEQAARLRDQSQP